MIWNPLRLSSSTTTHQPSLFFRAKLSSSSYIIHLTDLRTIWSESLTHSEINLRSHEENTCIDPRSEDQLVILLEKIQLALSGARGTRLSLTVDKETTGVLILHVHVDLPGGIPSLEWPMRLSVKPSAFLTHQLMMPLLKANYKRSREVCMLSELLKKKDRVIEKMLDELRDFGVDLGRVFPHALGIHRGKLERETAIKRIVGLAPFDFETWKRDQSSRSDVNDKTIVEEVFRSEKDGEINFDVSEFLVEKEIWWEQFRETIVNVKTEDVSMRGDEVPRNAQKSKVKQLIQSEDLSDSDEESFFETLPAPILKPAQNLPSMAVPSLKNTSLKSKVSLPPEEDKFLTFKSNSVKKDNESISEHEIFSSLGRLSREKTGLQISETPNCSKNNELLKEEDNSNLTPTTSSVNSPKAPQKSRGNFTTLKGKKKNPSQLINSDTEKLNDSKKSSDNSTTSEILSPPPLYASKKKPILGIISGKKSKKSTTTIESIIEESTADSKVQVSTLQSRPTSPILMKELYLGGTIDDVEARDSPQKSEFPKDKLVQQGDESKNINDSSLLSKISIPADNKLSSEKIKMISNEEENSIEKANRKRAELREEAEIQIALKASVRKKRRF